MTHIQHPWDPTLEIVKLQDQVKRIGQGAKGGGGSADDPDPGTDPGTGTDPSPHPYDETLDPPDNLVLTTGSFYNEIFIDASWEPSTSTRVYEYEAELTQVGVGVVQVVRTPGNSVRFSGLDPNTDYSVRVRGIATTNRSTAYLGPQTIRTGADAALPGQVQNVRMYAGVRTLQISWDDLEDHDVERGEGWYDIQLDTTITFLSPNFRFNRESGTITSFTGLDPETTYYGRVRAIDSSGNAGPFSAIVSGETGKVGSGDIQAESVNADHISSDSIETRHLKADQIEGRHIKANTADIKILKTSELTSAMITLAGGMFRLGGQSNQENPPYNYMLQDRHGIRSYVDGDGPYSGGTLNFELNVNTGGAFFKGNIGSGSMIFAPFIDGGTIQGALFRTAPPPEERIEMSTVRDIEYYSGDASESGTGKVNFFPHGANMWPSTTRPSGDRRAAITLFDQLDSFVHPAQGMRLQMIDATIHQGLLTSAGIYSSSFHTSTDSVGRWIKIPQTNLGSETGAHIWFHPNSTPAPDGDGVIAQYDDGVFLIRAARWGGNADKMRLEADVIEVENTVRILGGSPVAGKFLKAVDGFGNAVWDNVGPGGSGTMNPTGPAGGVLSGEYPNPGFAQDMVTQDELDAHSAERETAHGGIFVPKSLADSKGDILIATGAGVIGAFEAPNDPAFDGYVLKAHSAGQFGVAWGNAPTPTAAQVGAAGSFGHAPGYYYGPWNVDNQGVQSGTLDQRTIFAVPFYCGKTTTFDRIAWNKTSVGTSVPDAKVWMAIYYDDGFGRPLNKLMQSDWFDPNGPNELKSMPINQTLGPGLWWLAIMSHYGNPGGSHYIGRGVPFVPVRPNTTAESALYFSGWLRVIPQANDGALPPYTDNGPPDLFYQTINDPNPNWADSGKLQPAGDGPLVTLRVAS